MIDVPVILITEVLAVDVMLVLPIVAARDELLDVVPVATTLCSPIVTPAGTLLKVNRICVEFGSGAPALPFCVAFLQQLAQPSVKINAPADLAIFLFVKMVAVPAPKLVFV